jgi:hypothetical protein
LQAQSNAITAARQHSPAATFQVFLLMNRSLTNPTPFEGVAKGWLEKRSSILARLLFGSHIASYTELGRTEEEEKSCGHSEQLMLMRREWDNIRISFFRIAKFKLNNPKEWVDPQQVAIMLNRSPCSSCGRLLVAELETFWEQLAEFLRISLNTCRAKFQRLFIFHLGYTVKYGKLGKPKNVYPNTTILAALRDAGWQLLKLPKLTAAQRLPDACFDAATVASLKRKPVNLKKIEFKQEESDDEYQFSDQEDDDEDYGRQPPQKKSKR